MSDAGHQFASFVTSLRAPRVALCINDEQFVYFAMSAVRVHSRLWGGAGNTVVSAKDGALHPAVSRVLKHFDPDYVTTLGISIAEGEEVYPGLQGLIRDDVPITDPDERREFIAEIEKDGPHINGYALSDDTMDAIRAPLQLFGDEESGDRIGWLHPVELSAHALTPVADPKFYSCIETGDAIIDLAVALKRGIPAQPSKTLHLGQDISAHDISNILLGGIATDENSPFSPGVEDLGVVTSGYHRGGSPIVVLGSSGDDMSLAATLDRFRGNTYWLPVNDVASSPLAPYLGANLLTLGNHGFTRQVTITSTSLDAVECHDLFDQITDASFIVWQDDDPVDVNYVDPERIPVNEARYSWRVDDSWDRRFTAPVTDTGAALEMVTPPPLEVPPWFDMRPRRWITEVACDLHPLRAHPNIATGQLLAGGEDPHMTFVRISGPNLSYESGRWSFVATGASHHGQLAAPRLRWPSVRELLQTAAAAHGVQVRPSAPGKVATLTAQLWGGRDMLIADLLPGRRELVDRLLAAAGPDRPLESEASAHDNQPRIRLHGRCLVPFPALQEAGAVEDVREWLDNRLVTGAIRLGLVLECGTCPWRDFYPVADVGASFTCARCGSVSALTHERWRKPDAGPIWYHELHPTAAEFFGQHGDAPLLAVHRHRFSSRTAEIEFEVELVDAKTRKAQAEVDFTILGPDGLVIGEAKTNGKLDGGTARARKRDVAKLVGAAETVGADEICFATYGTWDPSARTTFEAVAADGALTRKLTVIENIESTKPTRTDLN